MHEMGIAMQIIEIAKASVPEGMASARIERINLKVGKLAAVVPDSLRFCFGIAAKGTRLDGAQLHIEEVPIVALCKVCNTRWTISEPVFTCRNCQNGSVELLSGRELEIDTIELEDPEQ